MLASFLFAKAHSIKQEGRWSCHWCGGPCPPMHIHDDPPPIPFVRTKSVAKRPAEPYVCLGCWLWRMASVTIRWLGGGEDDRLTTRRHSVLITPDGFFGIRQKDEGDMRALARWVLNPQPCFALMLKNETCPENLLQIAYANDHEKATGEIMYEFTLDNVRHEYSPYGMQVGIRTGEINCPGTRTLLSWLGKATEGILAEKVDPSAGNPKLAKGGKRKVEDAKSIRVLPALSGRKVA